MKYAHWIILAFFLAKPLSADRLLVLPPRIEITTDELKLPLLPAGTEPAAGLARAMILYLRVAGVSHVVPAVEAEGCLRQESVSATTKLTTEILSRVAQNCRAERALLTRIRRRAGRFEITTKIFYREAAQASDTIVKEGEELLRTLGEALSERFGQQPKSATEAGSDLIVAGDTFGAQYFDWQNWKKFLPALDAVKTAYCLQDSEGKIQRFRLQADKPQEKEFLDKVRFAGGYALTAVGELASCIEEAQRQSLSELRRPVGVFFSAAEPADTQAAIQFKSALRRIASRGKIFFVPAATTSESTLRFYTIVVRELGSNAQLMPSALRARAGLASGQEWYVFRRGGRLFESRNAEPAQLSGGVLIPEKWAAMQSPQDLLPLYTQLSGNKVVSAGETAVWNAALRQALPAVFSSSIKGTGWRVLLSHEGTAFSLSVAPPLARNLKEGEWVRIYTELLPAPARDLVRNRPAPSLLVAAHESSPLLEANIADYLGNPQKYLGRAVGGRSFWILSGKVLRVLPPERDVLDDDS
ncbi:MAG: hypothetical protein N2Z22_08105 [Turneriella sp.]|nr:hypothetical protein [Turneriella sp.]